MSVLKFFEEMGLLDDANNKCDKKDKKHKKHSTSTSTSKVKELTEPITKNNSKM